MPDCLPAVGDVFRLRLDGVPKPRYCLVTRVDVNANRAEILYGQGEHDAHMVAEAVLLNSAAGKMMRVTKDTYFRVTNYALVALTRFSVAQYKGMCPPDEFPRFAKLTQRARIRHAIRPPQHVAAAASAGAADAPPTDDPQKPST